MRNASIGASRQFLLGGLTLLTVVAWAQPQITYKIDTLAGQRVVEDGIPAIQAQLNFPEAVAIDGSGNLYIADTNNNSIRKVDPTGMITTVAGTGEYGFSGDGGPAVQAQLTRPIGVAMDSAGNLYIYATDSGGDFLIRKVDSTGTITKVAGPGTPGSSGSSFAFSQAQIARPTGVAVDSLGNLYIADTWDNRIRKIDPTGTITTVAGARGGFGGDGGPAVQAQLTRPTGVAVDGAGNLYITDTWNNRIRKVDSTGTITTVAGTGPRGFGGDGGLAVQAQLDRPTGVAVDSSGNLYVADSGNYRIRKIDSTGMITTVAGTGEYGFGGDGGPAVQAQFARPAGVTVDSSGNLYIADRNNHRIRKVDSTGMITTVAGTGQSGFGGDGGPAVQAQFARPTGVAVDSSGNLYIADRNNHRIRKVDSTGMITTVAGTGQSGFSGDGGPAVQAQLRFPAGVEVDSSGNLYIADRNNHRIRKVDSAGMITTVAGTGEYGFGGDGGPAIQAQLRVPAGVAVDSAGNLYIADSSNYRIRKVDSNGTITTIAGMGQRGFGEDGGDGGPAIQAHISPTGVAADGAGNIYIIDSGAIRKVDSAGTITTVAGMRNYGGNRGDGGPATWAHLNSPAGVAVDSAGNLYIADTFNHSIRKIDATGTIDTIAGGRWESPGFGGDGGLAIQALLFFPAGVAVDSAGNLYIADTGNERIRILTPSTARTRLDFAHFANGEGITSDLVYVNVADKPIRPALYFYDKEGHLIAAESVMDLTGDLEVTENGALSVQTEVEPLGERTISTHGRGDLVTGSVTVVSDGPIGGVLRFDLPGAGVAGVGASHPVSDAVFPARRQAEGISTAAALRNLETEAMGVNCRLMKGGVVLEEAEIPLAAYGQEARFIEELFPLTDTSDFVGSVRCTAPGLFTGVAVELDAGNRIFTTLPVVPVERTEGDNMETRLDFAHFANGGGITSGMVFVNVATHPIQPVLYFVDKEGNLIAVESVVDLTGDMEVTERGALSVQAEVEPLGELTISTHGRGELVTGSVTVFSDGPLGGVLRFDLPDIGVAGVGASQPARDAVFPVRRQEGGISTAAAIHNLGDQAMAMRCRLMKEGDVLEEVEIPLEAYGQEARFIEELFPLTDTSDFVGSVRCTSPTRDRFTGVAVELDAGNRIFTTLPVVPMEREREIAGCPQGPPPEICR